MTAHLRKVAPKGSDEIAEVRGFEVLDSRGNPTVCCRVSLASGASGTAAVPSGASTGVHEAHERRDGGSRYGGKGVRGAVRAVEEDLAAAVLGLSASDQVGLDRRMRQADGTESLEKLGANAVLAVSVAGALAAAHHRGVELYEYLSDGPPLLPLPMVNIVSGGAHAGKAVDVQDFLVIPVGAGTFSEAIEWAARVRRATAEVVEARGLPSALVADEGGLGPPLESNRAAFDLLVEGIERSGLEFERDVGIGLDIAATQFATQGSYRLSAEGRTLSSLELIDEVAQWCEVGPVLSIEDLLAEDDWSGWSEAFKRLGSSVQLIGDDLFTTRMDLLERGLAEAAANSVLIKVNQAGTLSDAADVLVRAKQASWSTVVSARSGETEDCWLADLAVGWGAGQIKVGSTTRSERTAKWNRLLQLEATCPQARFAGRSALAPLGR